MHAILPAVLLLALAATGAWAQDALRGKRLYHDVGQTSGAGVSCIDCHGGVPGALHGLGKAANNPAAIDYALNAIQQMMPLRGRLSTQDMADIAAYVGTPGIPSPEPRLANTGPAASRWSTERLEFPIAVSGSISAESTVELTNAGAVPLQILSAPVLDGPDAAQFTIVASNCAAGMLLAKQQSCSMAIAFQPRGSSGLRTASARIGHDWIRGGIHVALIGRVSNRAAASTR